MKTLIIDNYDSFTYNLYQFIAEVSGVCPVVIRNDVCTLEMLEHLDVDNIVISPGPGHPLSVEDFGFCLEIIQKSNLPILGVCLGHQGVCCAFGGRVVRANMPIHGQLSRITHEQDPLFANIPETFDVVRYHSLMAEPPLPACLKVIATTKDGLIMGIRHRTRPIFGVQYHPESICSEYGKQLLINFNAITRAHQGRAPALIHPSGTFSQKWEKGTTQATRMSLAVRTGRRFYEPARVFQALFEEITPAVWLDSSLVTPGSARFSMMGCLDGPLSYLLEYNATTKTLTQTKGKHKSQVNRGLFDFLNAELQRYAVNASDYPFPFCGGFVGYFGYELFQETLPVKAKHVSPYQDAQFLFLDRAIVFDHETETCYFIALCEKNKQNTATSWFEALEQRLENMVINERVFKTNSSDLSNAPKGLLKRDRLAYINDIESCLEAIYAGDSYEMCLTNQLQFNAHIDPLVYYHALRRVNPAPYAAFMRFKNLAIASSSIERFLRIDPSGQVESKPIKGTLPRGKTPEEDVFLAHTLQNHAQFRAENLMIVDLLRHDLGRISEVGSVHVPYLMQVESYKTVHQLVSTIRGQLRKDVTPIDCIQSAFPGGSMTGAPKIRTVEMLQQLEEGPRGIYSGSMGYLSLNGSVDLNIVIRTAIITENELTIGVGGAITALSNPEAEFDEMLLKAQALQRAFGDG